MNSSSQVKTLVEVIEKLWLWYFGHVFEKKNKGSFPPPQKKKYEKERNDLERDQSSK